MLLCVCVGIHVLHLLWCRDCAVSVGCGNLFGFWFCEWLIWGKSFLGLVSLGDWLWLWLCL